MSSTTVRPVRAGDLEAVITLDQRVTGTSRRGFYQKRFAAAEADPKAFVWLVASQDGILAGFVSAQILDGEFGGDTPVAVLDAVGTAPEKRGHGLGRALMAALEAELRARRVSEIHSEADWTEQDLIAFFAKSGFHLSPQLVLENACQTSADL
ncbi:MAG: GNAT family N-acetyltransferase [Magnetospirillum sp.]|nr:GNAT family N-acetyltransferase [Magnetospirillum sp.]